MDSFFAIPGNLYNSIFFGFVSLLSLFTALYYMSTSGEKIYNLNSRQRNFSIILASICAILLIIFLGFRPVSGVYFVDMGYYAHSYNNIYNDYVSADWSREWIWANFSYFCKTLGMNDNQYFATCELVYIGFMFLCCIKLLRNNMWVALLFFIVSFSFYGYGVNGIRNGIACSLLLYSITLLTGKWYEIIFSIILMIISYGIHHSILLPALCSIVAIIIKVPKYAICFWVISIFISLIAGNIVGDFFADLGFDERTSYFEDQNLVEFETSLVDSGFRWDFLLYSAMPVFFIWYLTVKRNFKDNVYNIISVTYILANAFWIMVIRSNFSNRFAYLSWFLYPLVIVYPLLRFKIWDNQDRSSAIILLAYAGFTFFMQFIYYG